MTDQKILGAVLAGGKARRFGRDKAAEPIDGKAMIDHVLAALEQQSDAIVICGRGWRDFARLDDRPENGLGPLGGLNAALHHAAAHGFSAVLSAPVDVLPLPENLQECLGSDGLAVFENQYLIGYWPVELADDLDAFIAEGGRAVHVWLGRAEARRVSQPAAMSNINRPTDLRDKPWID